MRDIDRFFSSMSFSCVALLLAGACSSSVEGGGSGGSGGSPSTSASTGSGNVDGGVCPETQPTPGGNEACSTEGLTCTYGMECCCGSCHPSLGCTCSGGTWGCFYTDACFNPVCDQDGGAGPSDAGMDTDGGACVDACATSADCALPTPYCSGVGAGCNQCFGACNGSQCMGFNTCVSDADCNASPNAKCVCGANGCTMCVLPIGG